MCFLHHVNTGFLCDTPLELISIQIQLFFLHIYATSCLIVLFSHYTLQAMNAIPSNEKKNMIYSFIRRPFVLHM